MDELEILEYVNKNSKYVSVNKEKIIPFLNSIENVKYHYWLDREKIGFSEKEFIIFAFICETMNFCFWGNRNWKVYYAGKEYIGSEALFYAILKEIKLNNVFLEIDSLKNVSKSYFKKILSSKGELPILMSKRFKLFKETVRIIEKKKNKFFDEIFSIKTDKELLEYIISNFKHFDDKSKFKGKVIHFNKKATLLVNDLFHGSETIRKNIKTVKNLSAGADYAIPKILKDKNILVYDKKLLNIINKKKMIYHNSRMEIEIRANTLYVLELMKKNYSRIIFVLKQ